MTFPRQVPLLLLIFFFLFPLLNASHPKPCYYSLCWLGNVHIRFPFSVQSNQPHRSCGYPGFNLLCKNDRQTALKLPNSKPFLVREIDYKNQRIRLNDSKSCLARRLLNFNTSGSPFSLLHPRNYAFLICPKNVTSSFKPIHCLANSTSSFFAIRLDNNKLVGSMMPSSSCRVFKTLSLSFPWSVDQDLWLKWDSPDCRDCEKKTDSRCGFINNSTLQVQCFSSVNSDSRILKLICLSLIGPLIALSSCVGLVMCSSKRSSSQAARLSGSSVTPQPNDVEVVTRTGLDESTIESYKKVELGESRRLPTKSNDTVCSICLSEYVRKDTVRCLPECEHCFHTECIDAWLKLDSSCPVCRSNPSPACERCN